MKLVALVGSTRKESLNLALVKTMEERYREKIEITVAKIDDLPYYNQDTEDNPSSAVLRLRKEIVSSDAVLIVTPEFNWSIPGVLKNALDWLSRADKELKGKSVMVAGASTGQVGSLRAQQHLRQILSSPGLSSRVLPPAGNEILLNHAGDKFKEGKLIDKPTLAFLDGVIERFIEFVKAE